MKKIIALLCAVLLLSVSFACAENAVINYQGRLRLSLALPEGYSYTEQVSDAGSLLGQIASQDPAAPVLAVAVAFNDNEVYIAAESLKDLSKEALDSIREDFSTESNVAFDTLTTASGASLLVVREDNSRFLDFYTVCLGSEIDLTLFPADGQTLTEDQIQQWMKVLQSAEITPVR